MAHGKVAISPRVCGEGVAVGSRADRGGGEKCAFSSWEQKPCCLPPPSTLLSSPLSHRFQNVAVDDHITEDDEAIRLSSIEREKQKEGDGEKDRHAFLLFTFCLIAGEGPVFYLRLPVQRFLLFLEMNKPGCTITASECMHSDAVSKMTFLATFLSLSCIYPFTRATYT